MIEHNPSIDPSNHAALMQNAGKINGAKCKEVKTTGLGRKVSTMEYDFMVDFQNTDGTLFGRGQDCEGNETDSPPQSMFIYTVIKDVRGKFLIMDMPPYLPRYPIFKVSLLKAGSSEDHNTGMGED